MSLTRAQWIEMWNHCNNMADAVMTLRKDSQTRQTILNEVRKIKELIESVIGPL